MKKALYLLCLVIVTAGILYPAFGQDKRITVFGTVTETGGTPIHRAQVLLSDTVLVIDTLQTNDIVSQINVTFDTVFTDSNGNFEKEMTVKDSARRIMYVASKKGYRTKFGYGNILNDEVDLGTIILTKGNNNTITVLGTVLDAVTEEPVEEALVILSKIISTVVDPPDSVYTDADGYFCTEMEIGPWMVQRSILYQVLKKGYKPIKDTGSIVKDTVNLGRILLEPLTVSVQHGKQPTLNNIMPNNVLVYSLRGQLLYSGPELNMNTLLRLSITQSQPLVACYRLNSTVLYKRKMIAMHE